MTVDFAVPMDRDHARVPIRLWGVGEIDGHGVAGPSLSCKWHSIPGNTACLVPNVSATSQALLATPSETSMLAVLLGHATNCQKPWSGEPV